MGIEGNILTLGSSDTRLVSVRVTDSSGTPVADGTPITWTVQKGSKGGGVQWTTVNGGDAYLTITGVGGSPIPGAGIIAATVGGISASRTYLYILPSGQFTVLAAHPLLAGDKTSNGSISIAQGDGTSKGFDYYTATTVTITNGTPGATIQIRLPQAGAEVLAAIGDDGVPGSTVNVTLDANGKGTFQVETKGQPLPLNQQMVVPITLWVKNFSTTVNTGVVNIWYAQVGSLSVAVQPAEYIANTLNYIDKLGWAIAAGPGNSLDEIVADLAFSLTPVVGVWSDIRDAGAELLKLWPGGEDFNPKAFGLAVAGIVTEFTPADMLVDVAKSANKVVTGLIQAGASPAVIAFFTKFFKGLNLKNLSKAFQYNTLLRYYEIPSIKKLVDTLEGGSQALGKAADPEAIDKLNKILQDGGQDALNLLKQLGGQVDEGFDAVRSTVDKLSGLSKADIGTLADAQKLSVVAEGIKGCGWSKETIDRYTGLVRTLGPNDPLVKNIDALAQAGVKLPVNGQSRVITAADLGVAQGATTSLAGRVSVLNQKMLVRVDIIAIRESMQGQQSLFGMVNRLRALARLEGMKSLVIEGISVGNKSLADILVKRFGGTYTPQKTIIINLPFN
jgi:hypothetical protein